MSREEGQYVYRVCVDGVSRVCFEGGGEEGYTVDVPEIKQKHLSYKLLNK
jgi:hypothetical protein